MCMGLDDITQMHLVEWCRFARAGAYLIYDMLNQMHLVMSSKAHAHILMKTMIHPKKYTMTTAIWCSIIIRLVKVLIAI